MAFTKQWTQPKLTSNSSFGSVSASNENTSYPAWKALDGIKNNSASVWESGGSDTSGWLKWDLPYEINISRIVLYNKYTGNTRLSKDVVVYTDGGALLGSGQFACTAYSQVTIDPGYETTCAGIYIDLTSSWNLMVGLSEIEITATVSGELTLLTIPKKTTYQQGEDLDLTGMEVAIVYKDNTSETVTDYKILNYDPSKIGVQTVWVMYENEWVTFDVTVEKGKYKGTVTVTDGSGSGTYVEGTSVTATALPKSYKHFTNWTATGVELDNAELSSVTFIMPANDVVLVANYEDILFDVIVSNGTGGGKYAVGVDVTIAAENIAYKTFTNWSIIGVELDNTKNPVTFKMPANSVIATAIYEDSKHAVTVEGGTGSGEYTVREIVQVQATIPSGKVFTGWEATGVIIDHTQPSVSFAMPDNDVHLIALFGEVVYDCSVVGGTGSGSYKYNEEVTAQAIIPEGYEFIGWRAIGIILEDPTQELVTFRMPANDVTLNAKYLEPERDSTDDDYNAESRIIDMKLELYLDGADKTPLEVLKANYLMDSNILEESTSDSDLPFGTPTANEISFTLFNEAGMFNPTNAAGQYYGKIKKGVKVKVFIRPTDEDFIRWDPLGVFYVSDWKSDITGITAKVTAKDKLYDVFETTDIQMYVERDRTFKYMFEKFFEVLGFTAEVAAELSNTLLYMYNTKSNKNFLQEACTGSMSDCFCGKNGEIIVQSAVRERSVRAVLTDADQIKEVKSEQSILTDYDGTSVVMYAPQESDLQEIASAKDLIVPVGVSSTEVYTSKMSPLVKIVSAGFIGTANILVQSLQATYNEVQARLKNENAEPTKGNLSFYGTYVETNKIQYSDISNSLLTVDNVYLQQQEQSTRYKEFLKRYIVNRMPTLTVEVRGNPKLKLGDKLRIVSERYNIDYTGILIRQKYEYAGNFSSTLTLVNSDVMEVS